MLLGLLNGCNAHRFNDCPSVPHRISISVPEKSWQKISTQWRVWLRSRVKLQKMHRSNPITHTRKLSFKFGLTFSGVRLRTDMCSEAHFCSNWQKKPGSASAKP